MTMSTPTNASTPTKEYGVFLPIGDGGWIMSTTSPRPLADYEYNKRAALHAEDMGLDFIMTMAKWRGFGGDSDYWGNTLESMTLMSGLAEATERVKVWATMHANIHHPAVAAKMYTTLQQISGGRAGMNIVNGAYPGEFTQMGLWDHDRTQEDKYRLTSEWCEAVTRLWSEDTVSMESDFFTLDECESRPHPEVRPAIISAGNSSQARAFQAEWCDGAFMAANDLETMKAQSDDVKARSAALGRECRTYAMLTVVQGDTDAEAEALVAEYGRGIDRPAIALMRQSWGIPAEHALNWANGAGAEGAFQTAYVAGAADTIVDHIRHVVGETGLDGLMLIFPEFDRDMVLFGETVLPELRRLDALDAMDAAVVS
ncbi:LLM class flavin-dependent oxidoreductase [Aeromicrobium sp. S22]|uniref:LLM class flavin-dependent oxidoreductase n=1 Tax=Aeromicrobium sp. S22 TaxID=2662029 RepID=UPI001E520871|nr:LLM class flavin-dependent oxidoreductase [Aeromicrobium sp. S22]